MNNSDIAAWRTNLSSPTVNVADSPTIPPSLRYGPYEAGDERELASDEESIQEM
jgi:hypothetical protein